MHNQYLSREPLLSTTANSANQSVYHCLPCDEDFLWNRQNRHTHAYKFLPVCQPHGWGSKSIYQCQSCQPQGWWSTSVYQRSWQVGTGIIGIIGIIDTVVNRGSLDMSQSMFSGVEWHQYCDFHNECVPLCNWNHNWVTVSMCIIFWCLSDVVMIYLIPI